MSRQCTRDCPERRFRWSLLLLFSTHSLDPCLWEGSSIIPLLVHQPAHPTIWPAAPPLQRGLSKNSGVDVWCVCECSSRDGVCQCVWLLERGHILCVSMICGREIVCSELSNSATSEAGKYLFCAANVW